MPELRPLHRLFGLSWIDFFQGTAIDVQTEMDLSLKQQFVDLVLIRKGAEPIRRRLPDGFGDLAGHNLLTFKSHQEALDGWALCELVGHYVNYRKQSSPSLQDLLPEADYRLTEKGRSEAGRRFAEEFSPLLAQGHGECNDPNCECRTKGPAECHGRQVRES